jgi:hypothetical protein
MANIDLMKVGIAVGVGAVDELLERQDDTKGRVDYKRWSNWERLALALGGWAMVAIGPSQYASWSETAAIAATPLLTKGIAKVVLKPGAGPTGYEPQVNFRPRRVGAETQDWAPTNPGGGNYRPL